MFSPLAYAGEDLALDIPGWTGRAGVLKVEEELDEGTVGG